jgi:hypothetical protein
MTKIECYLISIVMFALVIAVFTWATLPAPIPVVVPEMTEAQKKAIHAYIAKHGDYLMEYRNGNYDEVYMTRNGQTFKLR